MCRVVNGKERSRASCSVIRVGVIHEFNFKLSKNISWKSCTISHQRLPMGGRENFIRGYRLFTCDSESRVLGGPESLPSRKLPGDTGTAGPATTV